jgi:hypothetical protein
MDELQRPLVHSRHPVENRVEGNVGRVQIKGSHVDRTGQKMPVEVIRYTGPGINVRAVSDGKKIYFHGRASARQVAMH